MKYTVVIERAGRNYSAYVPDLPGCIATAKTSASVRRLIKEAVRFHVDGMRADGLVVPKPSARSVQVALTPAKRRVGRSRAA